MLLPDNIHPEKTVYFHGAFVLGALQKNGQISFFDLYIKANESHKLSMPLFVLCLDWLYLLGAIAMDEKGSITPCT